MATLEAYYRQDGETLDFTSAAADFEGGDVLQLPDGRAGVIVSDIDYSSNPLGAIRTTGVHLVTKAATQVWCDGDEIFWDHSANAATVIPPLGAGDRDFFLGCAVGDVASATTSGVVNLNVRPQYIIDLHRDLFDTTVVLTAGTPYMYSRGGTVEAAFSTTAEAQKLDLLSKRSFALSSNPILEAVVNVVTTCDADVGDLNIGFANGTHASDADSITESAFFHFDLGADLNIDAKSTDGTTSVGATDTLLDFAEGTPVHLKIDGRDPSNMKYYINGVEVLAATANLGNIAVAAGPLKALFHLEKSSNDSPGVVRLSMLRVRTSEQ